MIIFCMLVKQPKSRPTCNIALHIGMSSLYGYSGRLGAISTSSWKAFQTYSRHSMYFYRPPGLELKVLSREMDPAETRLIR
jgi:hypothetical protein